MEWTHWLIWGWNELINYCCKTQWQQPHYGNARHRWNNDMVINVPVVSTMFLSSQQESRCCCWRCLKSEGTRMKLQPAECRQRCFYRFYAHLLKHSYVYRQLRYLHSSAVWVLTPHWTSLGFDLMSALCQSKQTQPMTIRGRWWEHTQLQLTTTTLPSDDEFALQEQSASPILVKSEEMEHLKGEKR